MPKQFSTFAADKLRITTALPPAGLTDAFTVMAWVKWNSSSAVFRPAVYRFNTAAKPFIFLGLSDTGAYHFNWAYGDGAPSGAGTVNGATLNIGSWYHCAFTMGSRTGVSFLNGVFVGSATDSGANPVTTSDMLMFGNDDDADGETGLCSICAIKVFDYALTQADIVQEMPVAWPVRADRCTHWATLQNGQNAFLDGGTYHGQVQFDTVTGALQDYDKPAMLIWTPERRQHRFMARATGGGTVFTRSVSENLAIAEAFARTSVANRSLSDNLGISEALTRTSIGNRSLSENLGVSEAFARTTTAKRAVSEDLGILEAFARTTAAKRGLSDNLGISEAYARLANAARALSDTLAISEIIARQSAYNRAATDNLGIGETYQRLANAIRNFADSLGIQDVIHITTAGRLIIQVAELLGISDSARRTSIANRPLSDLLAGTDSMQRIANAARQLIDWLGLADVFGTPAPPAAAEAGGTGWRWARLLNLLRDEDDEILTLLR